MKTHARLICMGALISLLALKAAPPARATGAGEPSADEQILATVDYTVIVDEHDTRLPTEIVHCNYYSATGGDRGILHAEEVAYDWDYDSAYTARVTSMEASWTWGGMWYSLIRVDADDIPVDFGAIFGPYVKPEYQGQITQVEVAVDGLASRSQNTALELRVELKDENDQLVGKHIWTDLTSMSYPAVFVWRLPQEYRRPVETVLWILDKAQVGDSITVGSVRLTARVPDLTSVPTEEQAFLWTYSWLMANYDPVDGIVQDRSNFRSGDLENISATAKAAKIVYYAYKKGYTTLEHAEQIITKIADTLSGTVPRGPAGINGLWPHFTRNGGEEALPPHDEFAGTEWASGDTAFAALDIIAALEMLGDPQGQIPLLEQFVEDIDWGSLLTSDGCISHGYSYEEELLPGSWCGFGMETVGVNWAYASATGHVAVMGPEPSDNGSGFIDNAHYPVILSGLDHWGNYWGDAEDGYRREMADAQIGWYTPDRSPYLWGAELFGLSAAEVPEAFSCPEETYKAYGIGGRYACPDDGAGEVMTLHYSGMIADIKLEEAKRVWETLRGEANPGADFLEGEVVISPLNNMESMRVDKDTGACTINHLKGSWNLALQAEGWALVDPEVKQDLEDAIERNPFLKRGHDRVTSTGPLAAGFSAHPTHGVATYATDPQDMVPLEVTFTDYSIGAPTGWSWDFGDGGTAVDQNPTHEYAAPGFYTVTLTADNGSDSKAQTKERYIRVAFPDAPVPPSEDCHWAALDIVACATANIVQGYDDGLYHPEGQVTRDQMAVYISRALAGGDAYVPTGPATATFDDVPTDHWAYRYVEYSVVHDVVVGYVDGLYRPAEEVDRGQMAVYAARAKGWVSIEDDMTTASEIFPDVPAGFWAGTAIDACVENDVVHGYDDGYYRPDVTVTRDQMAVYVARAFGLGG